MSEKPSKFQRKIKKLIKEANEITAKYTSKKAYICKTDFHHDLDKDNGGQIEIFGSKSALKANKKCWKECGIYEVEIKVTKSVLRGTL